MAITYMPMAGLVSRASGIARNRRNRKTLPLMNADSTDLPGIRKSIYRNGRKGRNEWKSGKKSPPVGPVHTDSESVLILAAGNRCRKLPTEFHFGTAKGSFLAGFLEVYLESVFLS